MFSFKRFSEQFKIILMQNLQKQGLTLIVLVLVMIYMHFKMYENGRTSINLEIFGLFVCIMTIINSNSVFSDLLHTNSSIHYYMIPATISEKYSAAWLYSSLFTIAFYTLIIYLVHLSSIAVGNTITGHRLTSSFPSMFDLKKGFLNLMFIQSMFFLGAVVFKKNPFWKTVLTLLIIGIVIGMISATLIRWYILGSEAFNTSNMTSYSWSMDIQNMDDFKLPGELEYFRNLVLSISYSIPFICWIAAYFRLKTREV